MSESPEEEAWNRAGIEGFWLFVFGLLTFGIYPIVRSIVLERRRHD